MIYIPSRPPEIQSAEELRRYVEAEFLRISQTFQQQDILQLQVLHVEPQRPRDGMIAFADGTNWNPGAGAGAYERVGGAWSKL